MFVIVGRKDFSMVELSSLSDRELVSLCRKENNADAWDELSRRYLRVAKAVSASFGGSLIEHDDLIQEGIIGFLTAVCSYDGESGTQFSAYAKACIKNRMLSALGAATTKKKVPPSALVPIEENADVASDLLSPEEALISKNEAARISELIRSELTESERAVFALHFLGSGYREIAEKQGMSEKAVDGALQRARKKLRKALYN